MSETRSRSSSSLNRATLPHTHSNMNPPNASDAHRPPAPVRSRSNTLTKATTFGTSILNSYHSQLEPLQTTSQPTHTHNEELTPPATAIDVHPPISPTSHNSHTPSTEAIASAPSSPFLKARNSFKSHRRENSALSVETIPRQTIMKALASAGRNMNFQNLSIASTLSGLHVPSHIVKDPHTDPTQKLSAALGEIAARNGTSPSSAVARLPALQSPCFYHERFDDAVDIERVLEEINEDDSMSHSRLMQTATGVREVSKQLQRRPIKRAVRSVMIVTKARDNHLVNLTRELTEWLLSTPRYGRGVGVTVYVDAKLRASKRFNAEGLLGKNEKFQHMLKFWTPDLCWSQPEKFDLVLTLGGDGTVLFTSWLFQRIVPPILSFSLGSLGFLTNFEFERFKEHLGRVMGEEGMRVTMRMRFTCTVYRDGKGQMEEGEQFEVLNELVIDRGPSPYVSNLELYGDNELLTVVQADGCIFSTPTGSTAYSLSAGGSLVHPDIPAILLTPICPHTLSFRPMVLSDSLLLQVSIPKSSRATAYCSFDGKGRVELKQGDHVTIAASQYPFPTVRNMGRGQGEWFESVSRTLRWNVREVQKGWGGGGGGDRGDRDEGEGEGEGSEEELKWDIDTDSGFYGSEENSNAASPLKRQMSLLGMN